MKNKFIPFVILLFTFSAIAFGQNRIRVFDPVAIAPSDYNMIVNSSPWGAYKSAQVYLSCPTGERATATLTGPDGGDVIVDNALTINGTGVCNGSCFTLIADPLANVGMPVERAYAGIRPINVSRQITGTGLYTFTLIDIGYAYGNNAIYLNTSCSIYPIDTPTEPTPGPSPTPSPTPSANPAGDTVICHRDNGNREQMTLNVGASAVAAHLAHGDTLGPCGN